MSASDHRLKARENLDGNWGLSILVAFFACLLGGSVAGTGFSLDIDSEALEALPPTLYAIVDKVLTVTAILSLVQFIIGGAVLLGNCHFLLKQYDHEPFALQDLFSELNRLGQGMALKILTGLYTFLWALLLIIPGIVKSYSYAMAPFILAEHPDMTANQAITASKQMMDGHKLELFFLDLSFLGWVLLNLLTLGIGSLFLMPYIAAARASFYRNLCPRAYTVSPAIDPPCEF